MGCLSVGLCPLASAQAPDESVFSGRVLTVTRVPLQGARVLLEPPGGASLQSFTDNQGRFSTHLSPNKRFRLSIEHPGYIPHRNPEFVPASAGDNVEFILMPVTEHIESIEVTSSPLSVDMDSTSSTQAISRKELLDVPFTNTNDFRAALRTIPGVTRDNRGGLHVNGSAEDQVLFLLDGFNINDPLTGRFDSRFNVEAVQSAEVVTGALPAEYGKGSAAALHVRTRMGHDQFRYGLTNFFPGLENRKGWTIGDWAPRLTFSGPLASGRAWFSNSLDTQYVKTVVRDRPKGDDRTSSLRFSDMLSTQVNLTPGNILSVGGLWNHWSAGRTGLTALDPMETTVDRRSRQYFFHAKDQMYFRGGLLIEIGFAANRTFAREIPQGPGILLITPMGKRGNHYVHATRQGGRNQVILNTALPSVTFHGSHLIRFGTDLDRVTFHQQATRTGFITFSDDNQPVRQISYGGKGDLAMSNSEASAFVQDSWRVRPGLLLETGLRADWDRLLRTWNVAPRFGFAWSPPGLENTKLSGGIGRLFDASTLRFFSRPGDQYSLSSYYLPNGALRSGPALTLFSSPARPVVRPGATSTNLSLEHHWASRLSIRADLHHRQASNGLLYRNSIEHPDGPPPDWAAAFSARALDALYVVANDRMDSYRSAAFTLRNTLRREYGWMVNYTYSRARSTAVLDINVDDPVPVLNNAGPMPWDTPHRFLAWTFLPLPFRNWAVSAFVDARTGFPYSVRQIDGAVLGRVNSRRFPTFFELNLHLERQFVLRGHRWAWRMGANNLTGRINPDSVNSFAESSQFGRFYGGTGRAVNFRIRWLGRT